jgi:uncharacterized membrane protein
MSPSPYRTNVTTLGLPETLERVLAYALFWVSGLILFFVEKNPNVKRHALQSMLVFGPLFLIRFAIGFVHELIGWVPLIGWVFLQLYDIMWPIIALTWVTLMVLAAVNPSFRLPGMSQTRKYLS